MNLAEQVNGNGYRPVCRMNSSAASGQRQHIRTMKNRNQNCGKTSRDISLRPFCEPDLDFVITGQLALYAAEYGFTSSVWNEYLTSGVREFAERFDSGRDCMYIAECRQVPCGCIAITHTGNATGQLRFFFLVQEMRGNGAGHQLIDRAIGFCQERGYRTIFLWTFSTLAAARHLYAGKGFRVTDTHVNNDWGEPILEEKWELEL